MSEEHGYSAYTHVGCRCAVCCAANTAYHRKWMTRNLGGARSHGSDASYNNYACRCSACTEAHTTAVRNRRRRLRSLVSRGDGTEG